MKSNRLFDLFLGLDILNLGLKSGMFWNGLSKGKMKDVYIAFPLLKQKKFFFLPGASILN